MTQWRSKHFALTIYLYYFNAQVYEINCVLDWQFSVFYISVYMSRYSFIHPQCYQCYVIVQCRNFGWWNFRTVGLERVTNAATVSWLVYYLPYSSVRTIDLVTLKFQAIKHSPLATSPHPVGPSASSAYSDGQERSNILYLLLRAVTQERRVLRSELENWI